MLLVKSLSIYTSNKILSFLKTKKLINSFKSKGKRVGLCQGGFDLLHPGHVKHLESAKKLCDILVVSVSSDRYVGERKGIGRPIFTDKLRAYMISCLACVDYVVISDFKGLDVIKKLKPSFYIKGPDFIKKQTPGITAEREAIHRAGGEMKYTNDPKSSTTEIIEYIQTQVKTARLLIILDRDGTLVYNNNFLGESNTWKKEIKLNKAVISFVSYLQTKYNTTKIVVSNQSGVARGFFTEKIVKDINSFINNLLNKHGIKIDDWQFCSEVDAYYAAKHPEIKWNKKYIKKNTVRKPKITMVNTSLQSLGKNLKDYDKIIVIGDRKEDKELAYNIKAIYLNAVNKTYEKFMHEFSRNLKKK